MNNTIFIPTKTQISGSIGAYYRVKAILDVLDGNDLSIIDIVDKTKIPMSTVYKLTSQLLKYNIIRIKRFEIVNSKKQKVLTLMEK